jgi:hypothetical protein
MELEGEGLGEEGRPGGGDGWRAVRGSGGTRDGRARSVWGHRDGADR